MKLFLIFSFTILCQSSFAETLTGILHATEVEPIMVYEYVADTCTRTETNCQTFCNGEGENCGEQCSGTEVSYKCGRSEWVRHGSKPLFDLEVEYRIDLQSVSASVVPAVELNHSEVDTGVTGTDFVRTLLKSKNTNIEFSASEIKVEPQLLLSQKKKVVISMKAHFLDPKQINDPLQNKTVFTSNASLEIWKEIPLDALNLEICVAQVRLIGRNTRSLGCQKVKDYSVELSDSIFSSARSRRSLIYSFNWKSKGEDISANYHSTPSVTRSF